MTAAVLSLDAARASRRPDPLCAVCGHTIDTYAHHPHERGCVGMPCNCTTRAVHAGCCHECEGDGA